MTRRQFRAPRGYFLALAMWTGIACVVVGCTAGAPSPQDRASYAQAAAALVNTGTMVYVQRPSTTSAQAKKALALDAAVDAAAAKYEADVMAGKPANTQALEAAVAASLSLEKSTAGANNSASK